ncbi:MAG: DUF1572 family protein [Candidatus Kapaibacterium sp.]
MTIGEEFLNQSRKVFRSQKDLADKAIAQLSDGELLWQPDPESNSVAINMKHLAGNMISRWTDFLTSDGEKPNRHRDGEFEIASDDVQSLRAYWDRGYALFFKTIDSLTEDDLLKTVTIRNEPHTVIQAIQRQVSHYGYHVGQIVALAKHINGENWKTLSIPRGKSEEFLSRKFAPPKG